MRNKHFYNYYRNFKDDLVILHKNLIKHNAPHYHKNSKLDDTLLIQTEILTRNSGYLDHISIDDFIYFSIFLYYRVLLDQIMYYKYVELYDTQKVYDKFYHNSKHPKFIGPCMSGCKYNYKPREIFKYINRKVISSYYQKDALNTTLRDKINGETLKIAFVDSSEFMKNRIINFLNNININGLEIWDGCIKEIELLSSSNYIENI